MAEIEMPEIPDFLDRKKRTAPTVEGTTKPSATAKASLTNTQKVKERSEALWERGVLGGRDPWDAPTIELDDNEDTRQAIGHHTITGIEAPPQHTPVEPIAPVNPLDHIESFLERFVSYPSEAARVAHVLWIAHSHLIQCFETTPRLAFLSPEKASGKTRALELTSLLVPNAVEAVNVTPAYLIRKIGNPSSLPTILYDEVDTVFGSRAPACEELRGLLNAGHRVGASVGRCIIRGNRVETEELPAFSAVALAGIGDLPDTILSRSIIINMKRRSNEEELEPFRFRLHQDRGDSLRHELSSWCETIGPKVENKWPSLPPGIRDRAADLWEPLLAIAEAAEGSWPSRARNAAMVLVKQQSGTGQSLGVDLLKDLRDVFAGEAKLRTTDIIKGLTDLEEAPWGNLRGTPIDPERLGKMLRPYGVRSTTIRIDGTPRKGYRLADLEDAFERYLPPQT